MNMFNQYSSIANFVGLALGPLCVVLLANTLVPIDCFAACTAPLMSMAFLNMITASCMSFKVPLNLDQMSYTNAERSECAEYKPDILDADPIDVLDNKSRETIAEHGLLQVGIVALVTVGIEVGTSYIMEVEYHWPSMSIAIGMCAVFTIICVIVVFQSLCRTHLGTTIDRKLAIPTCAIAFVATMLYSPYSFLNWEGKYYVFAGDAIVYPSVAMVGGMMMNYAIWSANPDKWNYRDNLTITAMVTNNAVKFAGAPLVRFVISMAGRETYAIMQTALTGITLLNFMWVRNAKMYVDASTLAEAVPAGTGFFKELPKKKDTFLVPFQPDGWRPRM